jgi:hypothetical protein
MTDLETVTIDLMNSQAHNFKLVSNGVSWYKKARMRLKKVDNVYEMIVLNSIMTFSEILSQLDYVSEAVSGLLTLPKSMVVEYENALSKMATNVNLENKNTTPRNNLATMRLAAMPLAESMKSIDETLVRNAFVDVAATYIAHVGKEGVSHLESFAKSMDNQLRARSDHGFFREIIFGIIDHQKTNNYHNFLPYIFDTVLHNVKWYDVNESGFAPFVVEAIGMEISAAYSRIHPDLVESIKKYGKCMLEFSIGNFSDELRLNNIDKHLFELSCADSEDVAKAFVYMLDTYEKFFPGRFMYDDFKSYDDHDLDIVDHLNEVYKSGGEGLLVDYCGKLRSYVEDHEKNGTFFATMIMPLADVMAYNLSNVGEFEKQVLEASEALTYDRVLDISQRLITD